MLHTISFSAVQFLKAPSRIYCTDSGSTSFSSAVQPSKVEAGINSQALGRVTSVRLVQLANIFVPMFTTESGSFISVNPVQPLNASSSISVTASGIVTATMPLFKNAASPISVTLSGMTIFSFAAQKHSIELGILVIPSSNLTSCRLLHPRNGL